ncbi:hypothetical protein LguiB_036398 [Lonicera macranthoides]
MGRKIKEEEPSFSSSSYPAGEPSNNHGRHGWKYDVFLSFRGKDIRKTFVDHLYSALHQRGIFTFKDNERLETGRSIAPELLEAIELSRFAIVVFSKNHASSSWCLDELAKIMDCHKNNNNTYMVAQLIVIPIFYDVQPSDNVANGHEAKCIDIVVSEIQSKLPHTISSIDEPLVRMKCRIEESTKNIEGILLDSRGERKHIDIAIDAFREMHKLRLLQVQNLWTPRVPEYLPSELRWLIWDKFPSESLPPSFELDNLVGLQLYCSSIE